MSNTELNSCLEDLSSVLQELNQKLNIVGANLTEDEKNKLSFKNLNCKNVWDVINKAFEMDKKLDSIIYDMYETRKLKILQNMSNEILTKENFSNYCTVFYNIYKIILYLEILKENMKNNEDDKISLMTGFAVGTISRISNILPNLFIGSLSNKIYGVCQRYFKIRYLM